MKVVLFCGGLGLRLRDYSETIPKPMVPIGARPILWHVMKYYAHYGHRDFILCLGYNGAAIKQYFLKYDECLSNDFVLSAGGTKVELLNRDIEDWNITFVDTGVTSSIGQRLKAVEPHLAGESIFLANYADGLTDFQLPELVDFVEQRHAVGGFLAVHPCQSFHTVSVAMDGRVEEIRPVRQSDVWMNGGYFVLRQEIFDYLHEGEDLVIEPFNRLMAEGRLVSIPYEGFWSSMDTYKEKQQLDDLHSRGETPWCVWKNDAPQAAHKEHQRASASI
jgi:glucose-1-phosphate cytidylyltransferase